MTTLQEFELDAAKNLTALFGPCASSIEDALYCPEAVITVAITNEWQTFTEVSVTVCNNYEPLGQDFEALVTLREAERCW